MRLDVESAQQFIPPSVSNTSTPLVPGTSGAQDYLSFGVRAAQAGDRATARAMLLRSSEMNPNDQNVWLWLASISEYPEELMGFVDKVLEIDPYNDRAVQWRTATCSLLAKTFIQRGSDAAESDQPMYAEDCFAKALEYDPKNTAAMMWLASLANNESARHDYLNRIIELEPAHPAANAALANIAVEKEKAEFAEIRRVVSAGDIVSAVCLLQDFTSSHFDHVEAWMLLSHFTVEPAAKLAALERVLEIEPENPVAKASLESLSSIFGVPNAEGTETLDQSDDVESADAQEDVADVETVFDAAEPQDELPISPPTEALVFALQETEEIPATIELSAEDALEFQSADLQLSETIEANDRDQQTEAYSFEEIPAGVVSSEAIYQAAASVDQEDTLSEESYSIPIPADFIDSPEIVPARTGFETVVESKADESAKGSSNCPYCSTANDESAFNCRSCFAVLTLADLESLINNKNADIYLIRKSVDAMESERTTREFSEAELTVLGIGHLNLRNLQYGYDRLFEASRSNPDNVVLSSHVNSLLIRIDEIRRQEEVHAAMTTGKKILVVDDSPTIQKLIAGKLEKSGHEVFLSNDGIDALEQLKNLMPDLVLLDITMPNMDGYEVCRQIRGHSKTAHLPVVMISGKDGFFDKMRGRMAGSTGYITKPFGPETLMKAIEFYLGGGRDGEVEEQSVEPIQ